MGSTSLRTRQLRCLANTMSVTATSVLVYEPVQDSSVFSLAASHRFSLDTKTLTFEPKIASDSSHNRGCVDSWISVPGVAGYTFQVPMFFFAEGKIYTDPTMPDFTTFREYVAGGDKILAADTWTFSGDIGSAYLPEGTGNLENTLNAMSSYEIISPAPQRFPGRPTTV